jgi:CRISPR-associated protein Csx17
MEALGEVLLGDRDRAAELLGGALEDAPVKLDRTGLAHLRRDASPTNSPWGEATPLGNPWDLVLSIEGTVALAASASRKLAATTATRPAAPFTVWPTGAGYGSAATGESGRAELWLPLWEGWASFAEITVLAREFRAQVGSGRRLRDALTGLDFARAAGERGVALGLTAFERYALLERAGRSTLAVPAGRVEVGRRPGPKALRGIDRWLRRAIQFAAADHAPGGPRRAVERLQRRAYAMASDDDPASVCAMLEALGEVEASLAVSREAHGSLAPLRGASASAWIDAGDDGSHEFALAVAIASLHDYRRPGREVLPTVRDYLHGTRRDKSGAPEFDPGRRHVIGASDPLTILADLQARRHLDAGRAGRDAGDLPWDGGAPARLDSLRLLASGALDEGRLLALAEGLCALRHDAADLMPRPGGGDAPPEPMLDLMLLAWHRPREARNDGDAVDPRVKRGNKEAPRLGARPGWSARLAKGGARTVASEAILRLRQAGLPPILSVDDLLIGSGGGELERSRRVGAALLPHLGASGIGRLLKAQILTPEDNDQTKDEP